MSGLRKRTPPPRGKAPKGTHWANRTTRTPTITPQPDCPNCKEGILKHAVLRHNFINFDEDEDEDHPSAEDVLLCPVCDFMFDEWEPDVLAMRRKAREVLKRSMPLRYGGKLSP